jgi:hypothetical protein
MMTTTSLPELRSAIRGMLHKSAATEPLAEFWKDIVGYALRDAESDVRTILLGRGIAPADVTGGDDYAAVLERQAVYWAGQRSRDLLAADDKSLDAFDMRNQLATMPWVVGGVVVQPADTGIRQSSAGVLAWAGDASRDPADWAPRRGVPYPEY